MHTRWKALAAACAAAMTLSGGTALAHDPEPQRNDPFSLNFSFIANFQTAQNIVRAAQTQISQIRGQLGGFQKSTLETTANALRVTLENTTAAESSIRDTDFAEETSNLTRSQILVQSATNVLRLANAAPQSVLALLG